MKTRKMLAVLSALILGASACISAVPAKAEGEVEFDELDYSLYQTVLKDFTDSYGIPEREADDGDEENPRDSFGNNKNAFCRLIDFNNDGIQELYLSTMNADEAISRSVVRIYTIIDREVYTVYEVDNSYENAVFFQPDENQYYLYEAHVSQDDEEGLNTGSVYTWLTFNGETFNEVDKFVLPLSGEFNTQGLPVISSPEEALDRIDEFETITYKEKNEQGEEKELEDVHNFGVGSDLFRTRESVEASRDTYDYIMGLVDRFNATAVELAQKSTNVIASKMFRNQYEVVHANFPNRWFFYNDEAYDYRYEDILFCITADYDEHDEETFAPADESVIREKIESNDCAYSCVRSYWDEMVLDFPITDTITTSFDYLQVSEALDKEFDCRMIPVWSTGNGNLMGYEFEEDGCTVRLYFDIPVEKEKKDEDGNVIEETKPVPVDEDGNEITDPRLLPANVPEYYTAEELKELNPSLIGFEVVHILNDATNYKDLLDSYYDSITEKWENYEGDELYGIIYENTLDSSYMWRLDDNKSKMHSDIGYQFVDLDGDGIDELIFTPVNTNEIYDLYTLYNGEYVHLCAGGEDDKFYLGNDYRIYEETPLNDSEVTVQAYDLKDGALTEIETPDEWEYQILNLRTFDNTDDEKAALEEAQNTTEELQHGDGGGGDNNSNNGGNNGGNGSSEGESPITRDKLPIAAGITAIAALTANVLSRKKKIK